AERSQEFGMLEAIVPADSDLVGKNIIETNFRTHYGLSMIGLRRGPTPIADGIREQKLEIGDTLLLVGPWKAIRNLKAISGHDLLPLTLPAEFDDVAIVPRRSRQAI